MMKNISLYTVIFFIFFLVGCSKNDGPEESLFYINPVISNYSQSDSKSTFSNGDAMGVYIVTYNSTPNQLTDIAFNKCYTYNGASWSTEGVSSWPKGQEGLACNIYAYAPYNSTVGDFSKHLFTCPEDQSSIAKMKSADFLYTKTTTTKQNSPIELKMSHLCTLMTINVKYGKGVGDILSYINLTAVNNTSINLNTGLSFHYGNTVPISMALLPTSTSGYDKTYSCIIPDQNIDNDSFLTLRFNDGSTFPVSFKKSLDSGTNCSINLSVIGKKEVLVNSITVSPWLDKVTYTDGTSKVEPTYRMGDVIEYLKSSKEHAPVLVVVGDGFTRDDLNYGGLYEQKAKEAMDFLFNVEPFKTYKEYFNVYIIAAESADSGVDSLGTKHYHDSYFHSGWGNAAKRDDGDYGNMKASGDTIFNFVKNYCPDIVQGKATIQQVTTFLLINDHRYGGMTWSWSDGKCFAMCPLTKGSLYWGGNASIGYSHGDWRNTLIHEGGGHAFGRLADEYYDANKTYTKTVISTHSWPVPMGLNVTADISSTSTTLYWSHMIGSSQFPKEGTYEGGNGYGKGIWRPEIISCMMDNRRYYNACSRQLIVERILNFAHETFNYNTFLMKDVNFDENIDKKVTPELLNMISTMKVSPPLAPPHLVE